MIKKMSGGKMRYSIVCDDIGRWHMDDLSYSFVGGHLCDIADKHDIIVFPGVSESYLLSALNEAGIKVELIEEDGSTVCW